MTRRARIAALALPLLAAACGHGPRTTFLTLDAAPPTAPVTAYLGKPIAVPAVHLPAVLDRVEFVRQDGAGEVRIDDLTHWAAPLGLLARDALIRDLAARMPAGAVLPPGSVGGPSALTLGVTITRWDASAGEAHLELAWRRLPDGALRTTRLSAPLAGTGAIDAARVFASLLGQAADTIARDLSSR